MQSFQWRLESSLPPSSFLFFSFFLPNPTPSPTTFHLFFYLLLLLLPRLPLLFLSAPPLVRRPPMETQPYFLPLFFAMFFGIYLLAYFIVFRKWSPKIRNDASSCFISLFHGTPAVFLATRALLADSNRDFASPNTQLQSIVLDYSVAYFIMDLLHLTIFFPSDVLFIGHHLATLFVFITCRYVVFHGAYEILILLILAELTSAFQNAWALAGARKDDSELAAKAFNILSPVFYSLYLALRGVAGPCFVFKMGLFYANGRDRTAVPWWAWASWIAVIVAAISVSILWISNLWVDYLKRKNCKFEKKNS